ncbi:hypothetical protein FACS1894190_06860 [Spirochaetia bacterium]|nr:hypothetical protein FACS1894190_06860 [Spirochaetia bacterium]
MQMVNVTTQELSEAKTELWDIKELNTRTNIKIPTIRKFVQLKRIPYVKIGKLVRFRPQEIEMWIEHRGIVPDLDTACTVNDGSCFDFEIAHNA